MKWNQIWRDREKRNAYRILVWKSLDSRPLGRQRRKSEDNINLGLKSSWLPACGLNGAYQNCRQLRALVSAVLKHLRTSLISLNIYQVFRTKVQVSECIICIAVKVHAQWKLPVCSRVPLREEDSQCLNTTCSYGQLNTSKNFVLTSWGWIP